MGMFLFSDAGMPYTLPALVAEVVGTDPANELIVKRIFEVLFGSVEDCYLEIQHHA
jgi:hypothetical protein